MHDAIPLCRTCHRPHVIGADRDGHCAVRAAEQSGDRARYMRALRECADAAARRADAASREHVATLRRLWEVASAALHDTEATTLDCDRCFGSGRGEHTELCDAVRVVDELGARFGWW